MMACTDTSISNVGAPRLPLTQRTGLRRGQHVTGRNKRVVQSVGHSHGFVTGSGRHGIHR